MRLLDRYLLRCYLGPVLYCLTAFSMVFIISDLLGNLSKLMDAAPPVTDVLLYYASLLAPTLEYIVPASLLLATLYTLWQLSRNNELTAMRASGISLYRIMLPLLGVGAVLTLGTGAVKEAVAPRAMIWADEFVKNDFNKPTAAMRSNVAYYNTDGRRLWLITIIDLKKPHELLGVKVTQERADGTRLYELRSDRAEWLDGNWWIYDPLKQDFDEKDNPVGKADPMLEGEGRVIEMVKFTEKPADFVNELRDWMYLSTPQMRRYIEAHPGMSDEAMAPKIYDIHARLAMPCACFIVTLFGIPAGAKGARHSALAGIILAVAFFFGFYALSQVGLFMGKREMVYPWIGAWLSNMVFLLAGLIMLGRMR